MLARRESRSPSAAIEPEVKFAADEDSPESAGAKNEASDVGMGSSSELARTFRKIAKKLFLIGTERLCHL